MEKSFTARKRVRKYFGRLASTVEMPNLIEVQKTSHEQFLQRETDSNIRTDSGEGCRGANWNDSTNVYACSYTRTDKSTSTSKSRGTKAERNGSSGENHL